MLVLRLLGTPEILQDGHDVRVSRRKSRALLYYLAGQDGALLRQVLLSVFWADLPRATAQQTLRTTLHGLRRVLGDALIIQGDRVAFSTGVQVDIRDFETRLSALPLDPIELSSTLELYRGDFLEGFTLPGVQAFEDWLTVSRERYRRLALRGWTSLAAHHEAHSNFSAALDSLERALMIDRLQEDLQRDAIRLMYLNGDRPAAIRRYDELRRLLDDEMGVPPMAETRRLYDDMINDRLEFPATQSLLPTTSRLSSGTRVTWMPVRTVGAVADEIPFAGREQELNILAEALLTSRLALIEGDVGVGKTRLAEEGITRFVENNSALSIVGRGREMEISFPYQPFIEALRNLLATPQWESLRRTVLAEVPTVWLTELSRLLPEISLPVVASTPADEARLWEGTRNFISAVARIQPLVIFIDDLHWADASTLGLLAYLLRNRGNMPIHFLATIRTGPHPGHVNTFIHTLLRANQLRRILLSRLNREEIFAIAAGISVQDAPALAEWLSDSSEGNAYILAELVRYARQTGLLDSHNRLKIDALPQTPVVPQTVFSLIQSRLSTLSEEARRVLDAAVAQGREFEFPVVARAAGLSEAAALDALDELQTGGLIQPGEGNLFRFNHTLTMEVAYQEIGDLRHRRMHRRVAEALEQLHLDQLEQVAGRLAWHFIEGEAPQRGVRYALQAADHAARLAAWSETINFYEIGLKGITGLARLPVLIQLGEVQMRAGNFSRASETLLSALQQAESLNAGAAWHDEIRLALARSFILQARFAEVVELARQVRKSSSIESALAAEMIWGTALSLEGRDLDAAAHQLRSAQEQWIANRGADSVVLAQSQFELGNVAAQQGDLAAAVDAYRKSLATLSQLQSVSQMDIDRAAEQRILSYNNLAYHLHLMGDPTAAQYAHTGLELATERGLQGPMTYLHSTLGEIDLQAGNLDAAEEHFTSGLQLAEQFSAQERIAGLTANLGLVAARRGRTALAIHHLAKALGLAEALSASHLAARIRLWLVPLLPPDEARQHILAVRSFAESTGRNGLMAELLRIENDLRNES